MNVVSHMAMFGWAPLVLLMFVIVPQRHRAVIAAFIVGWMFLPMASYDITGLPSWDKVSATNLTVLLGVLLVDLNRVMMFRPRWYDLAMAGWCLTPFIGSIANGLGPYDGLSAILAQTVLWGIPYFIGRLYFSDRRALHDLGVGMILGAIAYAPLAIFEMRMSPMLHRVVYGFETQVNWESSGAFGPLQWRPAVFMQTSFSVTMIIGMAALVAFWFWRSGARRQLLGVPMFAIFAGLLAVTVLCKVWSGIILTFGGLGLLTLCWYWPTRAFLIALLIAPPMYMVVRASGNWSGEAALSVVRQLSTRRAQSLKTRFDNEDQLVAKALQEPLFGWGRWGRSRVRDERGRDVSLTDGLWVIAMGQYGLVGLTCLTLVVLGPLGIFSYRYPPWTWRGPVAVAVPFAVMLGLHMSDNLLNAFPNPVFMLTAGGLVSLPTLAQLAAQHRQAIMTAQRQQQQARRAQVAATAPAAAPVYPVISGIARQNFPQR